jgi:hypothetical protein
MLLQQWRGACVCCSVSCACQRLVLKLRLALQDGEESAAGVLAAMLLLPDDVQPAVHRRAHNSNVHKAMDSPDVKVGAGGSRLLAWRAVCGQQGGALVEGCRCRRPCVACLGRAPRHTPRYPPSAACGALPTGRAGRGCGCWRHPA